MTTKLFFNDFDASTYVFGIGDLIMTIGFPLFSKAETVPVATFVSVSALSGYDNNKYRIQIIAPVNPGSSGGPVVNRMGSLSALVVAARVAIIITSLPLSLSHSS